MENATSVDSWGTKQTRFLRSRSHLDECWENKKNANKRPNWFKSNTEKRLAAKDDKNEQYEDTKFLLMVMSNKMAFASNSNILNEIGLTNKQQAGKLDNIMDASGNGIKNIL
eukprot:14246042-Ditylum_brightwellii.AAC.1